MRTTITIDDDLTKELMQTTGEKSITAAIRTALQDYVAGLRKQKLLALRGQVQIEDTWQQLRQQDTAP
jgi:Arc/MetJ family transcription regulator